VAAGNLGNAIGASIGLAALFAASSAAFLVVKYAGAAYLIYLGVQALRSRPMDVPTDVEVPPAPPRTPMRRIFRDGFVVALLNPKTAVFFAAFLPQFMTPGQPHALQSVVLGVIFVAIAAATDTIYALAAGTLAPALSRARGARRAGRYASGGAFIGLGVYTVLAREAGE
jgi:threonine/homoserine/homoserine lactone efflux protein